MPHAMDIDDAVSAETESDLLMSFFVGGEVKQRIYDKKGGWVRNLER